MMTNSLCIVCKTNPQEFKIVDSVLVCCVDCNYKEEERQQTHCSSCNKITNSSRADYQDEFTCNDCGAEV